MFRDKARKPIRPGRTLPVMLHSSEGDVRYPSASRMAKELGIKQ